MEATWKPKIIGIYLIYGYYQKIFDLSQLPRKTKFVVKLPSPQQIVDQRNTSF